MNLPRQPARAEVILVALVRVPMRRLRRIDRHPADRIGNGAFADRAKGVREQQSEWAMAGPVCTS